jgi:hypothetical protein
MSKRQIEQIQNTVYHGIDPTTKAPKLVSTLGVSRISKSLDPDQHDKMLENYKKVYGQAAINDALSIVTEAEERSKRRKPNHDDPVGPVAPVAPVDTVAPDVPSGGKRRRLGRSQKRYNVSGHYTKRRGNKKRNTKRRGLSRRRRRGTHRK